MELCAIMCAITKGHLNLLLSLSELVQRIFKSDDIQNTSLILICETHQHMQGI